MYDIPSPKVATCHMGILLYTRVVRVFPELQGLMKVVGILLYTRVVSVCHYERSEESLGV